MVKNIAIMDKVYDELIKHKRQDESFSYEIMRLLHKKGHILDFAGAWKITEEEASEMKKCIVKFKKRATQKILKKVMK